MPRPLYLFPGDHRRTKEERSLRRYGNTVSVYAIDADFGERVDRFRFLWEDVNFSATAKTPSDSPWEGCTQVFAGNWHQPPTPVIDRMRNAIYLVGYVEEHRWKTISRRFACARLN